MNRRRFLHSFMALPFVKPLAKFFERDEFEGQYCGCCDPPTKHLHADPLLYDKHFEANLEFSSKDLRWVGSPEEREWVDGWSRQFAEVIDSAASRHASERTQQ